MTEHMGGLVGQEKKLEVGRTDLYAVREFLAHQLKSEVSGFKESNLDMFGKGHYVVTHVNENDIGFSFNIRRAKAFRRYDLANFSYVGGQINATLGELKIIDDFGVLKQVAETLEKRCYSEIISGLEDLKIDPKYYMFS